MNTNQTDVCFIITEFDLTLNKDRVQKTFFFFFRISIRDLPNIPWLDTKSRLDPISLSYYSSISSVKSVEYSPRGELMLPDGNLPKLISVPYVTTSKVFWRYIDSVLCNVDSDFTTDVIVTLHQSKSKQNFTSLLF